MTTERVHTLTGCARCGNGDRPGHMVPVGDERLCVGCAGVEIGRLRHWLRTLTAYPRHTSIGGENNTVVLTVSARSYESARAALGKEQP